MKTLSILLASTLIFAGQDKLTYTNPDLNLVFDYPKTWTLTTKSNEANAFIPIEGTEQHAKLEIRAAVYFQDPDTWQTVQADLAKSTRREMVRQWQEELLGVPMLMTRTQYTEDGVDTTRQTGMMYSATRKKLVYHLAAPTKEFDKVEANFKQALQSLRTIDGSMPKPEVPGREKGEGFIEGVVTRPPLIMRPPEATPKEFIKAPVTVATTAGGQNLVLRLPTGWTAEKGEGEKFTLKHPSVSTPVVVTVQSTLDSDNPERALIKATAADLASFAKVDKREDTRRRTNKAGATLVTSWRSGTTADGQLFTADAAGLSGDFYWMLAAKWTSPQAYKSDAPMIQALIQEMSVEPAQ